MLLGSNIRVGIIPHSFFQNMCKQKNFFWKILFFVGIIILGMQIYFFLNHRNAESPISIVTPIVTPIQIVGRQEVPTPSARPRISPRPAFISKDGEKVRLYMNKKYGFSFEYPFGLDITEETPDAVYLGTADKVVFGSVESFPRVIGMTIEPTTFFEPYEKVAQINKDFKDKDIKEHRFQSAEDFYITRQIYEKEISIDGYPALVTFQVTVEPTGGETNAERKVFFIKDKHLFTISTRYDDDRLWNSFKFDK